MITKASEQETLNRLETIAPLVAKAAAGRLVWALIVSVFLVIASAVVAYVGIVQVMYEPLNTRISSIETAISSASQSNNDRLIAIGDRFDRQNGELTAARIALERIAVTLDDLKVRDQNREYAAANLQRQIDTVQEVLANLNQKVESLDQRLQDSGVIVPGSFDFEYKPEPLPYPDVFAHINLDDWVFTVVQQSPKGPSRIEVEPRTATTVPNAGEANERKPGLSENDAKAGSSLPYAWAQESSRGRQLGKPQLWSEEAFEALEMGQECRFEWRLFAEDFSELLEEFVTTEALPVERLRRTLFNSVVLQRIEDQCSTDEIVRTILILVDEFYVTAPNNPDLNLYVYNMREEVAFDLFGLTCEHFDNTDIRLACP